MHAREEAGAGGRGRNLGGTPSRARDRHWALSPRRRGTRRAVANPCAIWFALLLDIRGRSCPVQSRTRLAKYQPSVGAGSPGASTSPACVDDGVRRKRRGAVLPELLKPRGGGNASRKVPSCSAWRTAARGSALARRLRM